MNHAYMVLLILQLLLIAVFLYCTYQADLAMDKHGVGDIAGFETLNKYAGIAFGSACILWWLVLLFSVLKRQFALNEAQLAIASTACHYIWVDSVMVHLRLPILGFRWLQAMFFGILSFPVCGVSVVL